MILASAVASAPTYVLAAGPPAPLTPEQVSTYRVEQDFTVANAGFEFITVSTQLIIRRAGLAGIHVARVTCGSGYVLTPRGRPGQVNMVACVADVAGATKLPATVTII